VGRGGGGGGGGGGGRGGGGGGGVGRAGVGLWLERRWGGVREVERGADTVRGLTGWDCGLAGTGGVLLGLGGREGRRCLGSMVVAMSRGTCAPGGGDWRTLGVVEARRKLSGNAGGPTGVELGERASVMARARLVRRCGWGAGGRRLVRGAGERGEGLAEGEVGSRDGGLAR